MAIFDELKSISKILQEAGKIEQYKQILEIQEKLLEMQNKINLLEEKNKSLSEKLKVRESLIFEKDLYWIQKNDKRDGPFCTNCWDGEDKLMRLHSYETGYDKGFKCPKCENKVSMEQKPAETQQYDKPSLDIYD